jgi:hypothetical protein
MERKTKVHHRGHHRDHKHDRDRGGDEITERGEKTDT